jgi:tetratricopeptide (TPR) repeat protein
VVNEEAEQQIRLWLQLAHEAYSSRQVLRALHYFHRALDYAQERSQQHEVGLVCRDLGYVYAQEESLDKALAYLNQGLAIPTLDLSVRTGLMANKASVLARLGAYRSALELLDESSGLILSRYGDFSRAPGQVVTSYAAIVRMADDLRKVVEILDMGVREERIQVEIKRQDPPWLASRQ